MSLVNNVIARIGIDKAVASAAAALAGATLFLIPVDILENAVVKAGLDTMFAPLAPPLGVKARLGMALVIAGMVFGIVLGAMTLLEALSKRPRKARAVEPEHETADDLPPVPRARRRDRHPDAPTRAPLSPARDLGLPESAAEPEPVVQDVAARLRRFRPDPAPEAAPVLSSYAEPEQAVWSEPEPEAEPIVAAEPTSFEPEPGPEPLALGEAEEEPALAPWTPEPEPEQHFAAPVAAVEEEAVPVRQPDPQPAFAERRSAGRRREDRPHDETISELMARLERALEGPGSSLAASPAPGPTAPQVAPEEVEAGGDDRLRSALEHLKRVASRA
jgi:hypothetical protein